MAQVASAILIALVLSLLPSTARAGDAFTGVQIDDEQQYFTYLGVRTPVPFGPDNVETFIQLFASGLGYSYTSNGQIREARAQALAPSVGIKTTLRNITLIGQVGPQFRRKEEDIPGGGSQVDYEVGAQIQLEAGRWEADYSWHAIASYADLDNFFWGRLRGSHLVARPSSGCCPTFLGWDIAAMGNDEFYAVQTGPLVEMDFGKFFGLVKGGYQHTATFQSGVYTGLELYLPF